MKDTNYTIQTSKDNYVTYSKSTDKIEFKQYYKAENEKLKQALEDIKDRLIAVTEEEPQSTINLVLDLKLIIEKILKEDK